MSGIQITILLAIFEYAIVLGMKRRMKHNSQAIIQVKSADKQKLNPNKIDQIIYYMDLWTMMGSALFFIIFNVVYWTMAKLELNL